MYGSEKSSGLEVNGFRLYFEKNKLYFWKIKL